MPAKVAAAIVELLAGDLAEEPARLSEPLRGELAGMRSARRGDDRVLLSIDEGTSTVVVVRIDHRSDVYRG